ncbi:Phosphatidate phosphatase [Mactra antiquata]
MEVIGLERKSIIFHFVSDVFIIGVGGIILLLFRVLGNPHHRGFFCDDQSLMYPFYESTVPSALMYAVGFIIALLLMCGCECIRIYRSKDYEQQFSISSGLISRHWILVYKVYMAFKPFVYGAVIEHVVTDIGKYSIGRLRPHFFDVCQLNMNSINCTAGYIEQYTCNGDDSNRIREMRLSFPSGHSSFSTYVASYLMIYIQRRFTFMKYHLIRPCIQTLLFSAAFYTCLSRVTDNKHHHTDVMAGATIGIVAAVLVAYNVSDLWSNYRSRTSSVMDKHHDVEQSQTSAL